MEEIINAVVIDDKEEDILAVTKALSSAAIPTIPIHYTGATKALIQCSKAGEAQPRIIITDIQMTSGGANANATDIRNTTNCLLKIISKTRGPYIILAWSSVLDSFTGLQASVDEVFEIKKVRKPVYFGKICKVDCGTTDGGFDAEKILKDFMSVFNDQKQIKALMHWEKSVLKSAIETVNSIVEDTDDDLEKILGSLGVTVAGKNLNGFEAVAINEAFSYILKDKLGQLSLANNAQNVWKDALTDKKPIITDSSKHTLNALLHIDTTPNKIICPGDVWILEDPQPVFNLMSRASEHKQQLERFKSEIIAFSSDKAKLDGRILKSKDKNYKAKLKKQLKKEYTDPRKILLDNMQPILLEISPACDFSNKKKPLKTLVTGVLVSAEYFDNRVLIKAADSIISCPIKYKNKDQYIIFTAKYLLSLSDDMIGNTDLKMRKLFRVRESLLQSWIHKINSFNSRIGTISFH